MLVLMGRSSFLVGGYDTIVRDWGGTSVKEVWGGGVMESEGEGMK